MNNIWKNGEQKNGIWLNGEWKNGIWHNGIWKNGEWEQGEIYSHKFKQFIQSSINPK